jgi:hypothetical protein
MNYVFANLIILYFAHTHRFKSGKFAQNLASNPRLLNPIFSFYDLAVPESFGVQLKLPNNEKVDLVYLFLKSLLHALELGGASGKQNVLSYLFVDVVITDRLYR